MSVENQTNVAKFFRQKTNGEYINPPTYFGAEQRFVGPLRNSNSNNLEEQFLLGADCMINSWKEGNDLHIKKEYFIQDTGDDDTQKISSYIIHTIIYGDTETHNEEYFFDGEELKVLSNDVGVLNETFTADNNDIYSYRDDSLAITPASFTLTREDRLSYVSADGTEVPVSTKYTSRFADTQTNHMFTQKKVVNHLKGEN